MKSYHAGIRDRITLIRKLDADRFRTGETQTWNYIRHRKSTFLPAFAIPVDRFRSTPNWRFHRHRRREHGMIRSFEIAEVCNRAQQTKEL